MSGVYGWLGRVEGDPGAILGAMAGREVWSPGIRPAGTASPVAGLGVAGPESATYLHEDAGVRIAWHGHPLARGSPNAAEAPAEFARWLAETYRAAGTNLLTMIEGDFALAIIDERRQRLLLAVDRMGARDVVYWRAGSTTAFGSS